MHRESWFPIVVHPAAGLLLGCSLVAACSEPPPERRPRPQAQQPAGRTLPPPVSVLHPPAGAERLPSGVAYEILKQGTGRQPPEHAIVTLFVDGWSADGTAFQRSDRRPIRFHLRNVIEGFREAVQQMSVGERRRVWIPERLAYAGRRGKPAGQLLFDVELVSFMPELPAPAERTPPADAARSSSGLAWRVLRHGADERPPRANDYVLVRYTGWTASGAMFDSTAARTSPARFRVRSVIPGWREALLTMRPGELRRLWVPEHLAYKGRGGAPKGTLIFDIELLEIEGAKPNSGP